MTMIAGLLTVLASSVLLAEASSAKAAVYYSLAATIIRLQHIAASDSGREMKTAVGTGFFVVYHHDLYLVSAGHMSKEGDLKARFETGPTEAPVVFNLAIPRGAWIHCQTPGEALLGKRPTIKPPDVAVAHVAWPDGLKLNAQRYCPEVCREGEDEVAGSPDGDPADQVLIAGYPKAFGLDAPRQRPLIRGGIVAMIGDFPYVHYAGEAAFADARVRVLDVKTFPGNSGSPVFIAAGFPRRRILTGMVSSGEEDLGIAIAEPVSRIREAIEYASNIPGGATATWLQASAPPSSHNATVRQVGRFQWRWRTMASCFSTDAIRSLPSGPRLWSFSISRSSARLSAKSVSAAARLASIPASPRD
jgi:hypothetical protein